MDDYNGNVKRATAKVFQRINNYLMTSNVMSLFRMMDRAKTEEIDIHDWLFGLNNIIHCKNSNKMLKTIYKSMDVGADHLGRTTADGTLSYVELARKIADYRPYPAPSTPNCAGDSDIPNFWRPPGSRVDLCQREYMPI